MRSTRLSLRLFKKNYYKELKSSAPSESTVGTFRPPRIKGVEILAKGRAEKDGPSLKFEG
jgi:hypothetical protein